MKYSLWIVHETEDGLVIEGTTWGGQQWWEIKLENDEAGSITIYPHDGEPYGIQMAGPHEEFKFSRRNTIKSGNWMLRRSRPPGRDYALSVANEKTGIIVTLPMYYQRCIYINDGKYRRVARIDHDGNMQEYLTQGGYR